MAELKTRENDSSVEDFLNSVADVNKRADCFKLLEVMQRSTGYPARMWGDSIVGFGSYHYKYASGHEGDAALTGFSPRKQNLTIYITTGFEGFQPLLEKLGKFTTSKACLYLKSMADIDLAVLQQLIGQSVEKMKAAYPHE
jgi:hypothetical protein